VLVRVTQGRNPVRRSGQEMTVRHRHPAHRDAGGTLDRLRVANTSARYQRYETVFAQGDRSASVMYIDQGRVKLTVTSRGGREAVVGILDAGTFFGEGALAGQRRRKSTALALVGCRISTVKVAEMRQRLDEGSAFSDWFRSRLLARNIRMEEELVDQLFNRVEKRLARLLLRLASFEERQAPRCPLPKISPRLLAETLGIPQARVNRLLHGFRTRGFLERAGTDGGLQVHRSMLSVVLRD
jgi:CRP-like cAMP-binding protein